MLSWLGKYVPISALTTLVGAAISAFGAVFVLVLENQYVGVAVVVVITGVIVSALSALVSTGERTKFERGLRVKSDEIAELNRTIAASVTGGDSFCYLAMGSLDDTTNRALLTVVHQGDYPLYDVHMRIVDLQLFRQAVDAGDIGVGGNYETVLQVGNMSPGAAQMMGAWQLPNTDEQGYNVFFSARNGFSSQTLQFKRVNGSWKAATQVTKNVVGVDEPPVLYERIDSDFPLNDKGQVEWD